MNIEWAWAGIICIAGILYWSAVGDAVQRTVRKQPEAYSHAAQKAGPLAGCIFAVYVQWKHPR